MANLCKSVAWKKQIFGRVVCTLYIYPIISPLMAKKWHVNLPSSWFPQIITTCFWLTPIESNGIFPYFPTQPPCLMVDPVPTFRHGPCLGTETKAEGEQGLTWHLSTLAVGIGGNANRLSRLMFWRGVTRGKPQVDAYNVNPGLINHGLLIRWYSPHDLILKWYLPN